MLLKFLRTDQSYSLMLWIKKKTFIHTKIIIKALNLNQLLGQFIVCRRQLQRYPNKQLDWNFSFNIYTSHYTRWTTKDAKDKQITTSKSVNYEFIRAWNIGKTSNIAAIMIDVLYWCKNDTKIVSYVGQIWLFHFLEDDNFCIFYRSPCIYTL